MKMWSRCGMRCRSSGPGLLGWRDSGGWGRKVRRADSPQPRAEAGSRASQTVCRIRDRSSAHAPSKRWPCDSGDRLRTRRL
jgi:hypothetical protein